MSPSIMIDTLKKTNPDKQLLITERITKTIFPKN